jgi:hypothetical protein
MITTKRKIKLNFDIEIQTYEANCGKIFELSDDSMKKEIQSVINNRISEFKLFAEKNVELLDKQYEFDSFKQNCDGLLYDESNKETYKHFVYEFLKKYYVDSYGSSHHINGGNWEHFSYKVNDNYHNTMLTSTEELSVKELIIVHLISGDGVRMYGDGKYYRRIKQLNIIEEQKQFWSWIFDSKMFDPNELLNISDKIHEYTEDYFNKQYLMCELIFYKCWRDDSLDLFKALIEEYKIDFYLADTYYLSFNKNKRSLLCNIIKTVHDERIHGCYNNGVLRRTHDYSRKLLKKEERDKMWMNRDLKKLVKFIKFLMIKYPLLKIIDDGDFYLSLKHWLTENLLEDELTLRKQREGTYKSANELIKLLTK